MPLSLSTSWNAFRYDDGYQMLLEIRDLGFSEVELSFNLTVSMIKGVEQAVKEGLIKVTSLHNTCPIPDHLSRQQGLPDYYAMSSPDEEIRRLAVKYALRSIDTANRLSARALVLHCGRVDLADKTRELILNFSSGKIDAPEFCALRDSAIKERAAISETFFQNTLKSLDEINKYAVEKGIYLGVENRFYYREIPSFEEVGSILDRFKGSNIFYWHDTGHAQIMSNLGFAPQQKQVLGIYGKNLLGLHLHDCLGCQDHLPPSSGGLDFDFLKAFVTTDTFKVIEAHHPASKDEVSKSRDFLNRIFNGTS